MTLSVASTVLIILKVIAGILSGSVSIISEAVHSGMNLIASLVALYSVRVSSRPADEEHPYGHGKIENISGLVEGLLIFVAAAFIIKEALHKIKQPTELSDIWVAIGVMLFSAVVNSVVSSMLYKTAREEDSIALEADALHLKTGVYTSLGVAAGLLLVKITGLAIFDPIVAWIVALLIIRQAWVLSASAFHPLLDTGFSPQETKIIKSVLERHKAHIIDYHKLRSRKSGNVRHLDFHITVREEMSLVETHQRSEIITRDLEKALKNTSIIIHIDPLGSDYWEIPLKE